MRKMAELCSDVAAELQDEQHRRIIRYSVTLAGDVAEAFERLHRELGGEAVLSRGDLTGRLLRRLLVEPTPERRSRPRRAMVAEGAEG